MNIFMLSYDPKEAARFHDNRRCVKMILESCQLLSTAHHMTDSVLSGHPLLYKKTHWNHPSNKWIRTGKGNYEWLWELTQGLCEEQTRRFGTQHKALVSGLLEVLQTAPEALADVPFDKMPREFQAMPEQFRNEDTVQAYRDYYRSKQNVAYYRKENGKPVQEPYPEWW